MEKNETGPRKIVLGDRTMSVLEIWSAEYQEGYGLLIEPHRLTEFQSICADWFSRAAAIFALAVPGVLAAIGVTATLLVACSNATVFATSFGWPHALVFSAIIAATDPIAVVALFKSLGAPQRLTVLTEGESLVNDGTAIVLFSIIYTTVTRHDDISFGGAAIQFLKVTTLGSLAGGGLALVTSTLIKRIDDPMIEITLTTLTAYGSFVIAEHFQVSGVISTVTTGAFLFLCKTAIHSPAISE